MDLGLQGRVALGTGASRGIRRGIAAVLAGTALFSAPLYAAEATPTVAELQAEGRALVGKAEVLGGRPHRGHRIGGHARPDQLDRAVEPVAALTTRQVIDRPSLVLGVRR